MAAKAAVTVAAAVRRELDDLARRDRRLAESALAASALALAREIDAAGNSATSKSMCAKALNETMAALYARAPAREESDGIDDLSRRRAARRAAT